MGSRKGIPNRNKMYLRRLLEGMYGEDFNPILKMAERASQLDKIASESNDISTLKSSIDAWDKVANYVEPKLKAVETSHQSHNPLQPQKIMLVPYEGSTQI